MEVQVKSTETVKPSSPTPQHLRHMTLCFLDQNSPPLTIPALLFYPAAAPQPLSITHLKTCLSLALTSFYPLAGRYQTRGTIILCNDEGIPFVESHVNCSLSDVLTPPYSFALDFLSLYPPHRDTLQSSGIQLAIQVNVFTCGGFAIGWYHTHKLTDGASAATFLQHWAALVAGRYEDAAQNMPDFKSALTAFPPVPRLDQPLKPQQEEKEEEDNSSFFRKPGLVRSFLFKSGSVAKLKAKSVSDEVANPTRFEAVAGFIWEQILSGSTKEGKSLLNVVVDLRPRTEPPLPKGAMGNLIGPAFARVENKGAHLPGLVREIHESVSKMKDVVVEYDGEHRAEAKERHWQIVVDAFIENRGKGVYTVTSWCKSAGFGDVDFGFGKPLWVVPFDSMVEIRNNSRNMILLTEYTDSDGDGFEAWLFLEEERIKYLDSNPMFLAFATPNLL